MSCCRSAEDGWIVLCTITINYPVQWILLFFLFGKNRDLPEEDNVYKMSADLMKDYGEDCVMAWEGTNFNLSLECNIRTNFLLLTFLENFIAAGFVQD